MVWAAEVDLQPWMEGKSYAETHELEDDYEGKV